MTERTQISDRSGSVERSAPQRRETVTDGDASARDRVLSLQRSAGNSAVTSHLAERPGANGTAPVQRAPDGPTIGPAPETSATVFRAGFFSGMWKKIKGWFSSKPKTGKPMEGATEGGTSASPDMTSKAQEEQTGGTSSSEGPTESTGGGTGEGGVSTPESTSAETSETPGGTGGGATESEQSEGEGEGSEAGGASSSSGGTETTEKTAQQETGPIAPETKKTEPEHPSPPPLAMDLASGEAVLKNAFGSMKTIVQGKLEILGPAAFKEAYDKIYGSGQWSWDRYVVPTYGSLNGFAHDGVNYINTASAGLHTVVHEMLHNNCAADWIPAVGSRFNEGTTEILTQVACKKLNVDAPVCYPGESPCVQALLDAGLPLADLEAAYLNGGAADKVCKWVDANCKENWAAFMGYMEAKNWSAAKAAAAKKTT